MKGFKTFRTLCSFALLITLGVLVLVCAALPPDGRRDLVLRPQFALQGNRQPEPQVWLALRVFGSPPVHQAPERRSENNSNPHPGS